jgi:2-aminoethylphosphonate-pyruvate transaminase
MSGGPVRQAVILAAGMGSRLGDSACQGPKGFIRLGDRPIIEEAIDKLASAGIERIVIVTGHKADWYDELARASGGYVTTVHNPRFSHSGSMVSLYCARNLIDQDFLLLESDLIFEQRVLSVVQACEHPDCVLLSAPTGSHDEVFVETDGDRLVTMSKDRARLGSVAGELVGISKISLALFSVMTKFCADRSATDLMMDYETDCLVAATRHHAVHCHPAHEFAWCEIDDAEHLSRARSSIYPEILRRDRYPV